MSGKPKTSYCLVVCGIQTVYKHSQHCGLRFPEYIKYESAVIKPDKLPRALGSFTSISDILLLTFFHF